MANNSASAHQERKAEQTSSLVKPAKGHNLQSRQKRGFQRRFNSLCDQYWNSWWPEILAIALSIACLIATAIVLAHYDGAPVPKKFLGITLNAAISILATAAKASLLFVVSNSIGQLKWVWLKSTRTLLDVETYDDASRGPLGALRMLSGHTAYSMASIGALLTLLAMALDPFVQQVVGFDTKVVFTPNATAEVQLPFAIASNTGHMTVQALTPAMYLPLLTDNLDIDPPFCPTANCIWPTFQALTWRSECHNETNWTLNGECTVPITVADLVTLQDGDQIVRDCSMVSADGLTPGTFVGTANEYVWKSYENKLLIKKNNSVVMDTEISSFSYSVLRIADLYTVSENNLPSLVNGSFDMNASFIEFAFLFAPNMLQGGPIVTRCSLDLYVDEYEVSVAGGETQINILNSWPTRKTKTVIYPADFSPTNSLDPSFRLNTINLTCFESPHDAQRDFSDPSSVMTEANSISGDTYRMPDGGVGFCVGRDVWLFDWVTTVAEVLSVGITTYINAEDKYLEPTNVTLWPPQPGDFEEPDGDLRGQYGNALWSFYNRAPGYSTVWSTNRTVGIIDDAIWVLANPEVALSRLGRSFTKYTLYANNNGTQALHGSVGENVTIVQVRWLWLILPYGIAFGGLLFMLGAAYNTYRSKVPLWKSSVNALLYHGIDIDMGYSSSLSTIPEMSEQAAAMTARLAPLSRDGRLVLETNVNSRQGVVIP